MYALNRNVLISKAARADLAMFQSLDKATSEIKKLQNLIDVGHLNENERDYCKSRIKYLRLMIEDNYRFHSF